MNAWGIAILQGLLTTLIWSILVALSGLLFRNYLNKQFTLWKTMIGVSIPIILLSFILTGLYYSYNLSSQASNLSNYISLNLVDDDVDDFRWGANDEQPVQPTLIDTDLSGIAGQFIIYSVNLTSIEDETGYSVGNPIAQIQRRLRESERGNWDTLLTTLYIESDLERDISVIPYLRIPGQDIIYLGFGDIVRTNEWSTLIWHRHIQSMVWADEFYNVLEDVRDEYGIPSVGNLRLSQFLTTNKVDGTQLGYEFRLISEEPQGFPDSISADIYISSVSFFP